MWQNFHKHDITVWESYSVSFLICLWPQRCQECLWTQAEGHIQTQQGIVPIFRSSLQHLRASTFLWRLPHKHSCYTMVSQNWKTWRKPERDWGSTGRKWNTPLDLKRKEPGQEDRINTHTFRELGLYEPEHHDLIRLLASAQSWSLWAFQINQSFLLDKR